MPSVRASSCELALKCEVVRPQRGRIIMVLGAVLALGAVVVDHRQAADPRAVAARQQALAAKAEAARAGQAAARAVAKLARDIAAQGPIHPRPPLLIAGERGAAEVKLDPLRRARADHPNADDERIPRAWPHLPVDCAEAVADLVGRDAVRTGAVDAALLAGRAR